MLSFDIKRFVTIPRRTMVDMTAIVGINSRHGLKIEARHTNQPHKSKLALYNPLLSLQQSFKTVAHELQCRALHLYRWLWCDVHQGV